MLFPSRLCSCLTAALFPRGRAPPPAGLSTTAAGDARGKGVIAIEKVAELLRVSDLEEYMHVELTPGQRKPTKFPCHKVLTIYEYLERCDFQGNLNTKKLKLLAEHCS